MEATAGPVTFYMQSDKKVTAQQCTQAVAEAAEEAQSDNQSGVSLTFQAVNSIPSGYSEVCDNGTVKAYLNPGTEGLLELGGNNPASICDGAS
jgi:hypothetical protein